MGGVGWGRKGWFLYCTVLPCYTVITLIEYLFIALLTLGTGLLSAYIVYKVVEPRAKRLLSDYEHMVPARIKKAMKGFVDEQLKDVDLGAIAGQIGGEGGGMGDIAGMLGGGGGGLGELLKVFSQLSSKGKEGGGSSGW